MPPHRLIRSANVSASRVAPDPSAPCGTSTATVTGWSCNRGSFGATEANRFSDGAQKVSGPLNGDSSGGGGECACVGGGVGGVVAATTRGATTNPITNSATKSSAPPRRPIPTIM